MVTAGAPHYGSPLEMPTEEARRGLTERLLLAIAVARGAAGKVRPPGSLIFMGSTSARRLRAGLGIASTVTVAFPTLIASLALELAPIRVNLIAAGLHATLGITPRWRARQAARRAPHNPAHPARCRTGRCRRVSRSHHEQHSTHRRDIRHRWRPAACLVINATRG